jgi:hypothetical protein
MNASSGKVALVNDATPLSGNCPSSSSIVDFVGYGSADCSEGSAAPTLGNLTALFRAGGGCDDTGNNSANFSTGSPTPRNISSPANPCGRSGAAANPTAVGASMPSSVVPGARVLLVVSVTPGADPVGTGITVTGDLTAIGGSPAQQFLDSGTSGDTTAQDDRFSFFAMVPDTISSGPKTIPIAVRDALSRNTSTSIQLSVASMAFADVPALMIFPQIAEGGGYKTSIMLTNATATNTTATISFYSDGGTPMELAIAGMISSSFKTPIPARGSAKLVTSGIPPAAVTGWAHVTASPPVNLNGNAVFQLFQDQILLGEASVPAVMPVSSVEFYTDEAGGSHTGFALANAGSIAAEGTLTLWKENGTIFDTYPISMNPGNHTAMFIWELLAGTPSGRAEINLTSGHISATALRYSNSRFSTVSVGQPGFAPAGAAAMFSPNGGVRNRLITEINRAQSTIDIAIYSFTADAIRDALISARNRGVAIRIIADTSQANGLGSEIAALESLGFSLKRSAGASGGIMHNKVMIIDGKLLFTGSYNWSASAEDSNFENAAFIQASTVIQSYIAEFNRIWAR